MENFTTDKGTVLPLIELKGKPYLQVAHRLIWFREEFPDWTILTEIVYQDADRCIIKAIIKDETGRIRAEAHKQGTSKRPFDMIPTCETGALGRALAFCGFGTQFCTQDIDEEDELADAPITPGKAPRSDDRASLIAEILGVAEKRGIAVERLAAMTKERYGKPSSQLTVTQLQALLVEVRNA